MHIPVKAASDSGNKLPLTLSFNTPVSAHLFNNKVAVLSRSTYLSVLNVALRWLCWLLLQTLKKYIKYLPTSGRIGLHHLIIRPNQKPPDYFFTFFSFFKKPGISILFTDFKLQLFDGIDSDFLPIGKKKIIKKSEKIAKNTVTINKILRF